MTNQKLDLIQLLEENKIYVAQSSIDLLKNSYVYDSSSFITLKSLDYSINGMTDLINYSLIFYGRIPFLKSLYT